MPVNSNIKELWEMRNFSDSSELKRAALDLRYWLAAQTDNPIAQFLAGQSEIHYESPDEPITDELEEAIARQFPPFKKAKIYLITCNYLAKADNLP